MSALISLVGQRRLRDITTQQDGNSVTKQKEGGRKEGAMAAGRGGHHRMKPHLENHLGIATQPTATALCNQNKLQNCVMHALQPKSSSSDLQPSIAQKERAAQWQCFSRWKIFCILVTQMAFVRTFKCLVEHNMLILMSVPTQAKQHAPAPAWETQCFHSRCGNPAFVGLFPSAGDNSCS